MTCVYARDVCISFPLMLSPPPARSPPPPARQRGGAVVVVVEVVVGEDVRVRTRGCLFAGVKCTHNQKFSRSHVEVRVLVHAGIQRCHDITLEPAFKRV